MTICVRCEVDKPVEQFERRPENGPLARRRQCRACVGERVRANRSGPEARAEFNRKSREYYARRDSEKRIASELRRFENFYLTTKGRTAHMLNNARARANRYSVVMTLTREWVMERLERGVCEVTGLPFIMEVGHGKIHRENAFSPSLERKDREGGYTPENTIMTCWIYNRAKGSFPQADFDRMCAAYVIFHEETA